MVQGELFGTSCSQYQIVPNKDTYLLGYGSIRTEGPASRSKSFAYSKLSKKYWKICQKWFRVHFWNFFRPISDRSK